MGNTWYTKSLPKIKDVSASLPDIAREIKQSAKCKHIYIFGSVAKHFEQPDHIVKDIDIIVKAPFHSGDLQSINKTVLSYKPEYLEEEGFDAEAVKFSKDFISVNKYNIDHWVVSSDNKLLHWGAIACNKEESDNVKEDAEKYASRETGIDMLKFKKVSRNQKLNWYTIYQDYLNEQFGSMPTGWYCSDIADVKSILNEAIKL